MLESKLVTTGSSAWAKFGSPLAVSGDVLVSGAPGAVIDGDMSAGAVYVFIRDPATNQWIEQKQLLPHDTADFFTFGSVLAIDGDTVAVAVPSGTLNGLSQKAAVYVFGRHHGGTDQWGAIAKISDAIVDSGGIFGSSIAMAGDLMVVGGSAPSGEGMVMVFERNRGGVDTWGKVGTILESDVGGSAGSNEAFGSAVALDGDNLLIGAPTAFINYLGGNDGSAYLFSRDQVDRDRWVYVTRLTAADDTDSYDGFGARIAVRDDTAVVGAPASGGSGGRIGAGAAYVFRRDASASDQWHQVAKLTASDGNPFDDFGGAIAFAGDTVLIGAKGKTGGFSTQARCGVRLPA